MNVDVAASLLGVEVSASKEEVLTAFKSRSRLVHPDRVTGESEKARSTAEELMKQLNMAKEVLLDYIANPNATGSAFNEGNPNTSGQAKAKPPTKPEPTYEASLTVEEQIAQFRAERKIDIDNATTMVKDAAIVYLVNLLVFLVVAGVTIFFVVSWLNGWNMWWMLASAAGVVGFVYMWRRTLVRFFVLTYSIGELGAYKKVSRQEERGYRKALKPEKPNSFAKKFKRLNDRF